VRHWSAQNKLQDCQQTVFRATPTLLTHMHAKRALMLVGRPVPDKIGYQPSNYINPRWGAPVLKAKNICTTTGHNCVRVGVDWPLTSLLNILSVRFTPVRALCSRIIKHAEIAMSITREMEKCFFSNKTITSRKIRTRHCCQNITCDGEILSEIQWGAWFRRPTCTIPWVE
jgi:hypothetical protein